MSNSTKYTKEAYIDEMNGREWLEADRLCYNQRNHWTWNGLRERAPTESG
ncbi:hypothetical protein AB4Z30_03260 [Paenibacillus sp. 2TAF8]|jgi:hypothetical protein